MTSASCPRWGACIPVLMDDAGNVSGCQRSATNRWRRDWSDDKAMISSMTAFGSGKHEFEHGSVSVELRSVNSRYLDLQFRMPDELRQAEMPLREKLMQRIYRGKIDIRLRFFQTTSSMR